MKNSLNRRNSRSFRISLSWNLISYGFVCRAINSRIGCVILDARMVLLRYRKKVRNYLGGITNKNYRKSRVSSGRSLNFYAKEKENVISSMYNPMVFPLSCLLDFMNYSFQLGLLTSSYMWSISLIITRVLIPPKNLFCFNIYSHCLIRW